MGGWISILVQAINKRLSVDGINKRSGGGSSTEMAPKGVSERFWLVGKS